MNVVVDHFYIVLFSALKQIHCARMWFYMSELLFIAYFWISTEVVYVDKLPKLTHTHIHIVWPPPKTQPRYPFQGQWKYPFKLQDRGESTRQSWGALWKYVRSTRVFALASIQCKYCYSTWSSAQQFAAYLLCSSALFLLMASSRLILSCSLFSFCSRSCFFCSCMCWKE